MPAALLSLVSSQLLGRSEGQSAASLQRGVHAAIGIAKP